MQIGPLSLNIHRTVRIAENRTPASLPPNLGTAKVAKVSDYRANCPASWEDSAVFVAVHEAEAIWLSFSASSPCAIICGAGGVNAVNGEPLDLQLKAGGYMVAPPQPWIDGWKADDGTVYQFVATRYEGGTGLTVGEQVLGEKSKSGGIGIAVFESKHSLTTVPTPSHYAVDPYGVDVWKPEPVAASAIYLVSAEDFAVLTGEATPKPVGQENYSGSYFAVADTDASDLPGASAFTGLKTVFVAEK